MPFLLVSRLLLASLPLVAFLTLRFCAHFFHVRWVLRHVPGPRASSFLWGEEWALYHQPPGSLYSEWHAKYGKAVQFAGAFGHRIVSLTDPRAITFILVENAYHFPKAKGVRAWFDATLGKGILWVEGKHSHERQRRILAPSLSPQSVRGLMPILFETSAKLASQLSKVLDQSCNDRVEIEITNWANRFALDTVGRAAFTYDFNCLSGDPDALADALDGLTNNEHNPSSFYMRALFWLFPSVLSIGKKGEMIRKTKQELGEIASNMWRDAKIAGDRGGKTVMSQILKTDETEASQMSEEELVSQMRTVISAGYETISAALAWILYELSVNAQVQVDLREEITTLQDDSLDAVNSLPLLDAVIKETLRLHPPIIENHHEASETVCIPLSAPLLGSDEMQIIIPKGTLLAIPLNVLHRTPKTWGSDAEEFRPSRWFGTKKRHQLLVFSEGPRACIGKAFATAELKVAIIALISQFSFECQRGIEEFQSFVVRPRVQGETGSSLPLLIRRV